MKPINDLKPCPFCGGKITTMAKLENGVAVQGGNEMTREEAVSLLEGEIIRCRMAPKINGCQMTEEWQRTIDVCQIAIDAIREKEQRRLIPVRKGCRRKKVMRDEQLQIL